MWQLISDVALSVLHTLTAPAAPGSTDMKPLQEFLRKHNALNDTPSASTGG